MDGEIPNRLISLGFNSALPIIRSRSYLVLLDPALKNSTFIG